MENKQSPEGQLNNSEPIKFPEKSDSLGKNFELNPIVSFENIDDDIVGAQQTVNDIPQVTNTNVSVDEEAEDTINEKDISWVEKAEEIIDKDKDDPYEEERDSEALQKKYLKSRFGVNVHNRKK